MKNSTGISFVYITLVLGQPIGLPRKVCLYAGADWLTFICHSEGGGKSVLLLDGLLAIKKTKQQWHLLYIHTLVLGQLTGLSMEVCLQMQTLIG